MNRIIKILIYIFIILIVMAISIYMYQLYDIRNNGAYYCSLIKEVEKYNYGENKYNNNLFYDPESNLYIIEHAYNDDVQLKLSKDDKEVIDINVDVKMFNDNSGLIISTPGPLYGNKKFKVKDGDYKIIINLDEHHSIPYMVQIETVFNNIYTDDNDIIEPQVYRYGDDLYVSFIELRDVMDYIIDTKYDFDKRYTKLQYVDRTDASKDMVRQYLKSDYAGELKRANVQTIKIPGYMFYCSNAYLVDYYPKLLI